MPSLRILIVDDHLLARAGVQALLAGNADFTCVGACADGPTCMDACDTLRPDIVLLDHHLGGVEAWSTLDALVRRHPGIKVVMLTAQRDPALARRTLRAGASGFVCKDFVLDELAYALRSVAAGRPYVSASVALDDGAPAPAPLSPRQTEILCAIARGLTSKEIARDLGISLKTVAFHRAELIQRLDLHDVASLTRYAVAQGLLGTPADAAP